MNFSTPPRFRLFITMHDIVSGLKMFIIREKIQFSQKRENLLCNLWNKEKYFLRKLKGAKWYLKLKNSNDGENEETLKSSREATIDLRSASSREEKLKFTLDRVGSSETSEDSTQACNRSDRTPHIQLPASLNYSECSPKTFAPSNRLSNLNLSPPNVNWTVHENVENKRREKKIKFIFYKC